MSLSRKGFLKMLGLGALAAGSNAYGLPSKALQDARAAAKKLKITDVEIYLFDIGLTSPFRIAIGVMNAANDVLVRVRTDQGIVGLGEACPFPPITGETQATNVAAAKAIRDMIVGKDPLAIDALLRQIGPLVHANPSMVAAFDMAFHDILGKVAGLPLFRLLGGTKNVFETDITTSIDTLENMTAESKKLRRHGLQDAQGQGRARSRRGFRPARGHPHAPSARRWPSASTPTRAGACPRRSTPCARWSPWRSSSASSRSWLRITPA